MFKLTLLLLTVSCTVWSQEIDEETKKRLDDIFRPMGGNTTEDPFGALFTPKSGVTDSTTNGACTRPDGKPGVCVSYYQCDSFSKKVITDGTDIFDVRQTRVCPKYFDVCCLPPEVNLSATPPVTEAPKGTSPLPGASVAPSRQPEPDTRGCGYSNAGEVFRTGSDVPKAEFLEFPWVIALLKTTAPSGAWSRSDYIGGGTLIHPSVVVTAAHKVDKMEASEVKARAGEFDTQTQREQYKHQEQDAKLIVQHKDFYRPPVLNSIALVFLKAPFTINLETPHIGIGCLGRQIPPEGTKCWGVGWGRTSYENEESHAAVLKKITVPLMSRNTCQNALRGTRLGVHFRLHESLTCAGGEPNADTCVGDGGSPLICSIGEIKDNRFAVFGAVAYGIGCGTPGVPGVYVNLPHFHKWIEDNMKLQGLDGSTYKI